MKNMLPLALIIFVLYLSGKFIFYNKIVMDMCDSAIDMRLQEVHKISNEKGVLITRLLENGIVIVHTTKNFGRGVCVLRVSDGVVVSAQFDLD